MVAIFPNRAAGIRLAGALLAELTDEWAIAKCNMSIESLKTPRLHETSLPTRDQPIEAATR